jgi:electron transfer flavoprotein alpha subunit
VAELLDLPFLAGVRGLVVGEGEVDARCEYDDGFVRATASLPAVLSCAERLCDPAKVEPEGRAEVAADRIRRLDAADLGPGPWGQAGSPTHVGRVEVLEVERSRLRLSGPVGAQVAAAVELMRERGAIGGPAEATEPSPVPAVRLPAGPIIAVALEPARPRSGAELLGAAAHVAQLVGGHVMAVVFDDAEPRSLASLGADAVMRIRGAAVEEDAAAALAAWCQEVAPWAVLAPGTIWGREVAARVAAHIGAGLTGDAVDLAVEDGRLVGWKPAFGGALVAAITAASAVQMVTVRPGVLPLRSPRAGVDVPLTVVEVQSRDRVRHLDAEQEDELGVLATADVVVGVGTGVPPDEYDRLGPLLEVLGAELGATRKVTDKSWLPRSRQIGITGRSISPRLYVAIGVAGKFNHVVGVRGAGFILAVNNDPDALVFESADAGIVGDWREVVPLLAAAIEGVHVS